MALRRQIVDLVRLEIIDELGHMDGIGKIAIVKKELFPVDLRICIEMVDTPCSEGAGPPDDAVDFIAFGNK